MIPGIFSGPFKTSTQITDYSTDHGFALRPVLKPGRPGTVTYAMDRLDRAQSTGRTDEKAAA